MIRLERKTALTLVACLAVLLAGCSGWGTDGPAKSDDPDPAEAGALEDADADAEDDGDETDTGGVDETDESDAADADSGADERQASDEDGATESDTEDGDGPDDGQSDESDAGGASDADGDTDEESNAEQDDSGANETTDENDEADGDDGADGNDENPPADETGDEGDSDDGSSGDDAPEEDTPDEGTGDAGSGDGSSDGTGDGSEPEIHTLTVWAGEAVPVADIPITLERHSDGATTTRNTGSDGTVEFTVIDGEYTVSGTDANGDSAQRDVTVDGEDTEVMLSALAPEEPDAYAVSATVTDAETGEPIEGAAIDGLGERHPTTGERVFNVTTGADGTGETEAFAGTYEIDIYAEGYEQEVGSAMIDGDTELDYELVPAQQAVIETGALAIVA